MTNSVTCPCRLRETKYEEEIDSFTKSKGCSKKFNSRTTQNTTMSL